MFRIVNLSFIIALTLNYKSVNVKVKKEAYRYLVSERKLGIFSKIKSKIPDFERRKAKIITTGIL